MSSKKKSVVKRREEWEDETTQGKNPLRKKGESA